MLEFLRKDLLLILAVVAVLLSLSYAIGYVSERPPAASESEIAFLGGERAPKPQPGAERIWSERSFEKLHALNSANATKPSLLRVDSLGNLYLLDWADFQIKMFSPEGNLVKSFGEGKGTGAGGFANPTSFSVRPQGELWVCDPPQRKLTRFNPDGAAQVVMPQSAVDRITSVDDLLITKAPPSNDMLFEIYNLSGERLKSFGELLENQSEKGIMLDGDIVGDAESHGFIYGGRYVGVLAGYGTDGEQRFIVQTIDGIPPPKVLNIEGRKKVKPNTTHAILSLSILGDELYVLSGVRMDGTGGAGGQIMDVYDKRNGKYLSSLKLPVACWEAIVSANRLYTLGDSGVAVWRF